MSIAVVVAEMRKQTQGCNVVGMLDAPQVESTRVMPIPRTTLFGPHITKARHHTIVSPTPTCQVKPGSRPQCPTMTCWLLGLTFTATAAYPAQSRHANRRFTSVSRNTDADAWLEPMVVQLHVTFCESYCEAVLPRMPIKQSTVVLSNHCAC